MLANLALDGLEGLLKQRYPRHKGLKVHLIRYADDFVITCGERTVLAEEIRPLVEAFLAERGLHLSPEKTVITHIDDGFDFLGQTIRKFKGKLIIKPSRQSQQTLLEKVRQFIDTEGQQLSAAGLIRRLNPLLRGWANYHRHVVAKRTFQRIDNEIFQAIWGWVRRRHPEKSNDWRYHHYFVDRTGRACPFQAEIMESDGQRHTLELVKAAHTPIRRHVKIQGAANPYDPAWETYFEQRRLHKTVDELPDRYQLRALWRLQRGLCPVCGELINLTSGWHIHHLVWRVYSGSDELENLVLLHPACHTQLHHPDFTRTPLRPATGV